jgi:UDP-N-acetylmuramoylalanine--D-glutamate ligase
LVGNIGYSFAKQVAEGSEAVYVAEIKFFQLGRYKRFRADVALLLNITKIIWTGTIISLKLYQKQIQNHSNQQAGDYFIYCADDEVIMQHLKTISLKSNPMPFSMYHEFNEGAWIKDNQMTIKARMT